VPVRRPGRILMYSHIHSGSARDAPMRRTA
jgi:hypothetical protein